MEELGLNQNNLVPASVFLTTTPCFLCSEYFIYFYQTYIWGIPYAHVKQCWEYGEEGDLATDYKDISTQGEWRTCVALHDICGVFSLPSGTSDFSLMIGEQLRCWEDWWLILQGEQSCWSAFPLGDLAYGCVGVKNKARSHLLNKHLLSICKFKIFYWEILETYRPLVLNIIIKRHQCKLHGQKTV